MLVAARGRRRAPRRVRRTAAGFGASRPRALRCARRALLRGLCTALSRRCRAMDVGRSDRLGAWRSVRRAVRGRRRRACPKGAASGSPARRAARGNCRRVRARSAAPRGRGGRARRLAVHDRANALRLTETLADLRGAAMKLGQLLSLQGEGLLPPRLREALAQLQNHAHFMPEAQVRQVLAHELGRDWKGRFAEFDFEPLAAASIGQVHAATARDGRDLALKLQYPGVERSIDGDVDNLALLLRSLRLLPAGFDLEAVIPELKEELRREADYAREARSQEQYRALVGDDPGVLVPRVHADLSTRRVLASDRVRALPIEDLRSPEHPQRRRDEVGAKLLRLVFRELFEFHFVQTDPNFANYLFEPKQERVALLDFGAVRSFSAALRGPLPRADLGHDREGRRRGRGARERARVSCAATRRRRRARRSRALSERVAEPLRSSAPVRLRRLAARARGARARHRRVHAARAARALDRADLPAPQARRHAISCSRTSARASTARSVRGVRALSGAVRGPAKDPLYVAYHDEEWGVPLHDDRRLFEMLILEGAQAGLIWLTILRKREALPARLRRLRPARASRATPRSDGEAAGRRRHRAQPAEDRGRDRKRARVPRARRPSAAASTPTCGASSTASRASTASAAIERRARADRRCPTRSRRTSPARLQVRRLDDLLRLHAGDRHGERPPDDLSRGTRSWPDAMNWKRVASAAELGPGQMKRVFVAGIDIALCNLGGRVLRHRQHLHARLRVPHRRLLRGRRARVSAARRPLQREDRRGGWRHRDRGPAPLRGARRRRRRADLGRRRRDAT